MIKLLYITDFIGSYSYSLLRGIQDRNNETHNWDVLRMPLVYKRMMGMEGLLQRAREWGLNAIIGQFDPEDDLEPFHRLGIITITQDHKHSINSALRLTEDYHNTGRQAARYFMGEGFRNFAFFGYSDTIWSDSRCDGFCEELRQHGYGDSISVNKQVDINLQTFMEYQKFMEWLQNLPKPVGIFCCNDEQGMIIISACNALGINVPTQISVMGVDNDETLCKLCNPQLSSIQMDLEKAGYNLALLVEGVLNDGKKPSGDIMVDFKRVVPRMSIAYTYTDNTVVSQALAFIHANLGRKIGVTDILQNIPVSRRLLEEQFKTVIGDTVYSYISKKRVELYANRILESNDPINVIAWDMGEEDPRNIGRRFKQMKGCTPQEWRERFTRFK